MKYCDKFFRFPVKLYLAKDIEKRDDMMQRLGIELSSEQAEVRHVIGWESVLLEDIRGFGTLFSRERELDEIEMEGFDCTLVSMGNGKEIGCAWSPDKFEEKLNEHANKLIELENRQREEDIRLQAVAIRLELEEQIIEMREQKKPWWKKKLW